MGQQDKEVINLVAKHFPECVAVQSDIEWESDVQLVVYVDLHFVHADPNHVYPKVCAAFCDELREEVKRVLYGFALAQWVDDIAIRIMLSFIEAETETPDVKNRNN